MLSTLSIGRLLDFCRIFSCEVRATSTSKDPLAAKLALHLGDRLPAVLRELGRDELRAVCRRHDLDQTARARADLQALILTAAGLDPTAASVRPSAPGANGLPSKGQIVHARHRQWLVENVVEAPGTGSSLVRLVCLDDDDPGRHDEARRRALDVGGAEPDRAIVLDDQPVRIRRPRRVGRHSRR